MVMSQSLFGNPRLSILFVEFDCNTPSWLLPEHLKRTIGYLIMKILSTEKGMLTLFKKRQSVLCIVALLCGANVSAQEDSGWFLKPSIGMSVLSNQTGTASDAGDFNGEWDVDTSSGFNAGLGLGYQYNSNVSVELYWEYRTNDTDTALATSGEIFEGNYASNMFYLNGYYHFTSDNTWQTYVGAGIGWTQEIDIDIEENGTEYSYSGDGDIGFQVMLGADYKISDNLTLNGEVRYGLMSSIDLEAEENSTGTVTGFDYNPFTVGVGVKYRF
jgi:outer membrane protein W